MWLFSYFLQYFFKASIILVSDFCWPKISQRERVFLVAPELRICSSRFAVILQFLYLTCVQGCSGLCAGFDAASIAQFLYIDLCTGTSCYWYTIYISLTLNLAYFSFFRFAYACCRAFTWNWCTLTQPFALCWLSAF